MESQWPWLKNRGMFGRLAGWDFPVSNINYNFLLQCLLSSQGKISNYRQVSNFLSFFFCWICQIVRFCVGFQIRLKYMDFLFGVRFYWWRIIIMCMYINQKGVKVVQVQKALKTTNKARRKQGWSLCSASKLPKKQITWRRNDIGDWLSHKLSRSSCSLSSAA